MYFFLEKPKAEGLTTINLIYYLKFEKKNFKYSTRQKILGEDWDFNSRLPKLKRGSPGKKLNRITLKLNQYKDLLESTIEDLDFDNQPATRSGLKNVFDNAFKIGYTSVIEKTKSSVVVDGIDYFIQLKSTGKGVSLDWRNKYINLKNKIELFDLYRSEITLYQSLTSNWLDKYTGFLRSLPELLLEKKFKKLVDFNFPSLKLPTSSYNDNTLNRHVIYLFTFLNWSKGELHSLDLTKLKNPVKDFETDDVHLTTEELNLLERVKLKRPAQDRARDLFLIGVYSGQRFSDYSVFESADVLGDMIIKRSEKTETNAFIPLHDKLKDLLEKYEWKLPKISSQKFNVQIRKAVKNAGINTKVKKTNYTGNKKDVVYYEKWQIVSSHTARRTFITLAAERGMPDHIIMKITGIRDPKTLLKYKKTNQQAVADFMNKMWG